MSDNIFHVASIAGIKRDGTAYDSNEYTDGVWVRFQRKRPRKIRGYRELTNGLSAPSRGMYLSTTGGVNTLVSGHSMGVDQVVFDNDLTSIQVRQLVFSYDIPVAAVPNIEANLPIYLNGDQAQRFTKTATTYTYPGTAPTTYQNNDNLWQFDVAFSPVTGKQSLLAHPGRNLFNIANEINTPVFFGALDATSPMFALYDLQKVPATDGTFTTVGSTAMGATTITLTSVEGIRLNGSVTGTGIANNTTVTAINSETNTITISPGTSAMIADSGSITINRSQINAVPIQVSGGCTYLSPFIFVFGNTGLVKNCSFDTLAQQVDPYHWSGADYPQANETNVGATKVVQILPVRGGANSPSGLIWSLNGLVRVSYVTQNIGSSTIFWKYDQVSNQISVLSSQSIIEINGLYYWLGNDAFYLYNGVVRDVPNEQNYNFLFDNLNYVQRQKVFVMHNSRWNEIWWFYPDGANSENTNAIIHNYKENLWYDAGFAEGARRTAGIYSQTFRFPICCGYDTYPVQNVTGGTNQLFSLWQHEIGTDAVRGLNVEPILSTYTTADFGFVSQADSTGAGQGSGAVQNINRWTRIIRVEPDFNMTGTMTIQVIGRSYANDEDTEDDSKEYPFGNRTGKVDMREQRRIIRLKFTSNEIGGDYETGRIMCILEQGDERGYGS